ncbi:MAG: hypothetical protein DYH13_02520 [Alphaproteobacteria bacterium PRO2]|nr:hypothetical protein [Alphaproteobacteria bacterium PRO2]
MSNKNNNPDMSEAKRAEELLLIKSGACSVRIGDMVLQIRIETVVENPQQQGEFIAIAILTAPSTKRAGIDKETGIEVLAGGGVAYVPVTALSQAVPLLPEGWGLLNWIKKYAVEDEQKNMARMFGPYEPGH